MKYWIVRVGTIRGYGEYVVSWAPWIAAHRKQSHAYRFLQWADAEAVAKMLPEYQRSRLVRLHVA